MLQSFIFQKTSAVSVNEVVASGCIMPSAFPTHDSASLFPVRLVPKLTTISVNQWSASQGSLRTQSDIHQATILNKKHATHIALALRFTTLVKLSVVSGS